MVPIEWTSYHEDDLHFSIDSPITLEENKPPAGLYAKTVQLEGHDISNSFFFRLNAVETKYEVDMDQEINKQVNTLKEMNHVLNNLQVTTGPVTLSGAPGLIA